MLSWQCNYLLDLKSPRHVISVALAYLIWLIYFEAVQILLVGGRLQPRNYSFCRRWRLYRFIHEDLCDAPGCCRCGAGGTSTDYPFAGHDRAKVKAQLVAA